MYKVMSSILVCITFRSGSIFEKVYVRVMGTDILMYVISNFAYIWSVLCKNERFVKQRGYFVSIEDADCMLVAADYTVTIDC